MKASSILSTAAIAAVASADLSSQEVEALNVLFEDINSNRDQYVSYLASATGVSFPTDLINIYTQMTTYTDDGYTSLFATIGKSEIDGISALATKLPWYSSRLVPEFVSAEAGAQASGAESEVSKGTASAGSEISKETAAAGSAYGSITSSVESEASSVASLIDSADSDDSDSETASITGSGSFTNATEISNSTSAEKSSSVKLTSVSHTSGSASASETSGSSSSASKSSSAGAAQAVPLAGLSLGASFFAYMLL